MKMLQKLSLYNFRNHTKKHFDFHGKKVVFFGQNGRGKTNILEAISLLSLGKSWREKTGTDLIEHDQESSMITATIKENKYKITLQPRSRSIERNEKKVPLKKHLGDFPTLLFAPEHLNIFHGTKIARQQFFDRFLAQTNPQYTEALTTARKASKQKNALLKQNEPHIPVPKSLIDPWNTILAETIPVLWKIRQEFLQEVQPLLQTELKKISGNSDTIEIKLEAPEIFEPTFEGIQTFFSENFARECAARKNLLSPSRDDFVFLFRDKPILATASRGEERSVLLALLSAKKQLLKKIRGFFPILLLDDSFSELDNNRQKHLETLCDDTQVFFTTTHAEHFAEFHGEIEKFEIT